MEINKFLTKVFLGGELPDYNGSIEINGLLDGNITGAKKVIITPSGCLYGNVIAKEIEIFGLVDGNIETENLTVYPSGHLHYKYLRYRQILIEEGSTIINKNENVKNNTLLEPGLPDSNRKSQVSIAFMPSKVEPHQSEVSITNTDPKKTHARNKQLQFYNSY